MVPPAPARCPPTARLAPGPRPSRPIVLSTGRGTKKLTAAEALALADALTAAARAWADLQDKQRQSRMRSCRWCGEPFLPRRGGMVSCSDRCRHAYKVYRMN